MNTKHIRLGAIASRLAQPLNIYDTLPQQAHSTYIIRERLNRSLDTAFIKQFTDQTSGSSSDEYALSKAQEA